MRENPERTSVDLQKILLQQDGLQVSTSHLRKLRRNIGWESKKTKFCQLVRDVNKQKRLQWALTQIANKENFDDVIFSDESSFEAQRSASRTYYKKGEPVQLRPKPKHPVKVSTSARRFPKILSLL